MKIPIAKPYFDEEEKREILKPLTTGWVVQGVYVKKFEEMFGEYTKAKYSVAVTSCTAALHLALVCLNIDENDIVVLPSFTYVATANAVEYVRANPVFCDIDLKTFNINIEHLEKILDKQIKSIENRKIVIMPVNLFGLCANLPEIKKIVEKYSNIQSHTSQSSKFYIIEDSACGFDAWVGNKHSGTFGDIGCFSFHPRKSLTTGEGGMLITNKKEIFDRLVKLRNHGASKSDMERHFEKGGALLPEFNMVGYNYRMTDFQGAIGICQMKKAKWIMNERRKIAAWYYDALSLETVTGDNKKLSNYLIPPFVPQGYIHGFQSYVCLFTGGENIGELFESINIDDRNKIKDKIDKINIKRNEFMKKLEKMGIATRQGTHAVHTLGYYRKKYNFNDDDFIASYAADRLSVALPLYAGMTREEFDYVIQNIKKALSYK